MMNRTIMLIGLFLSRVCVSEVEVAGVPVLAFVRFVTCVVDV